MAGRLTISTLNNDTGVLATQNGMTGIAKAWVTFAGSTATITFSFNVSSVTRNSTGNYTVNYTTALTNATNAIATNSPNGFGALYFSSQSASSVTLINTNGSGTAIDGTPLSVIVCGS
jgi:hypothetical protein